MSDLTQILGKIESGDEQDSEDLLPLVYKELRKRAADRMVQEKPGQNLQAMALVRDLPVGPEEPEVGAPSQMAVFAIQDDAPRTSVNKA